MSLQEQPPIDPIKKINHIKDVTISTLKVNLWTNIPGNSSIELTSGMLHQPGDTTSNLSNYPFFTTDMLYNPVILNNMSYSQRKQFFFDKDYFTETLTFMINNKDFYSIDDEYIEEDYLGEDMEDDEYEKFKKESKKYKTDFKLKQYYSQYETAEDQKLREEKYKKKNEEFKKATETQTGGYDNSLEMEMNKLNKFRTTVINANIMLMLQLLFPTSYLTVNNVSDSHSEYIKGGISIQTTPMQMLPYISYGLVKGEVDIPYSYISLNGSIYTTASVLWLNDILNGPKYKRLIIEFIRFNELIDKEKGNEKIKIVAPFYKFINDVDIPVNYSALIDEVISGYVSNNKDNATVYRALLMQYTDKYRLLIAETFKIKDLTLETLDLGAVYKWLDIIESLHTVSTKIDEYGLIIPGKLNALLKAMYKDTERMRIYRDINDQILNKSKSIISLAKDESRKESIQTIFPFYSNFINVISDFIEPNTQSTNIELQKVIYDYYNGVNNNLKLVIWNYIKAKFIENGGIEYDIVSDSDKNYYSDTFLYTGITYSTNGGSNSTEKVSTEIQFTQDTVYAYEIDVLLDVIGGQIDDTNKSKIDCRFKSEQLGYMFRQLAKREYPWKVDQKRFYITVDELLKKPERERKFSIRDVQGFVRGGQKKKNGTRKRRRKNDRHITC